MRPKPLPGHRGTPLGVMSVQMRRNRRVDLVVTDSDFSGTPSGFGETDGFQPEVRCTIPLAVLSDNVSGEALREVGRLCGPCPEEPIGTDDLLRLIGNIFAALGSTPVEPDQTMPSDAADSARIARLTVREQQVLEHVIAGHPNKKTATALGISRRTVEHHRAAIMHKTRAKSVPELVHLALRTGLFAKGRFAPHD